MTSCANKEDEVQKWEYKTVVYRSDSYSDFYSRYFNDVPGKRLDELGEEGWELVDVYTVIETVHTNFGNDKYVTGLQANTRTQFIHYIFKRPYRGDNDEKKEYVVITTGESEAVETTATEPAD